MLYIASDHAGFALKEYLKHFLSKRAVCIEDLGAHSFKKTDDYPDYALTLAKKIAPNSSHRGILICGSGQGMCIAANRNKGVRAALAWDKKSAVASRHDDNANILCLAGRMLTRKQAEKIILIWLFTEFSGFARHKRRLKKLDT